MKKTKTSIVRDADIKTKKDKPDKTSGKKPPMQNLARESGESPQILRKKRM